MRDRLGHHLERPKLHPRSDNSRGEFYSIGVVNGHQRGDSRTRIVHLGKNTSSRIISKGIAAGYSENT